MDRWQNCVAVVTGASSGIGEACAKQLAEAGLRVVALARRIERITANSSKLTADAQGRYFPRQCDVSDEEQVKATFKWIEETLGGVDILVNNAGCAREGNVLDMDTKLIGMILNTNLMGVIYCTQAAFRSMKARNVNGHLIHINSVAGSQVLNMGPEAGSVNVYAPSKFALTALNEVFRQELNGFKSKIKTTNIHPGLVATEILPNGMIEVFSETILSPSDVAETVLYVISTPQNVLIKELTVKPVGEIF